MDAELKQALAGLEARVVQHFDEGLATTETKMRQYTDERLTATEAKMHEQLAATEVRMRQYTDERLAATEVRVQHYTDERLENTETRLLTAFHNWAQTYEIRVRGTVATVRDFDDRLAAPETRVSELERGRNGKSPGGPKN
jgi:hypothetical protein